MLNRQISLFNNTGRKTAMTPQPMKLMRIAFAIPYAQTALNHQDPPLTSQQIDKLMGHSKLGEHYGNDQLLPTHKQTLLFFLNNLPELFKLNNYK